MYLFVALLFICVADDEPEYVLRKVSDTSPGTELMLGSDGDLLDGKSILLVCTSFVYLDDCHKFLLAKDKIGIEDLMKKNHVCKVVSGTKARLIKYDSTIIGDRRMAYGEVRILEGEYKDKLVCVPFFNLVKPVKIVKPKGSKVEPKKNQKPAEEVKKEEDAKNKDRANELLKAAKRWLSEGDKELALRRIDELLKRFPSSKAAPDAKKLKEQLEKK